MLTWILTFEDMDSTLTSLFTYPVTDYIWGIAVVDGYKYWMMSISISKFEFVRK